MFWLRKAGLSFLTGKLKKWIYMILCIPIMFLFLIIKDICLLYEICKAKQNIEEIHFAEILAEALYEAVKITSLPHKLKKSD